MKQIFINLPVADLQKSMHFYLELGFTNNPLFTSENQICMVWSEQIYVMLQSKTFFSSHIKTKTFESKGNLTPTFTLPVANLEQVNQIVENGLKAGGVEPTPLLDEGFMVVRNIEDLDGHNWGIIYLDTDKFKEFKSKR